MFFWLVASGVAFFTFRHRAEKRARKKSRNFLLAGTLPLCSDEEFSSRAAASGPPAPQKCSQKIVSAIWCQSLQAFQQRRASHECCPEQRAEKKRSSLVE